MRERLTRDLDNALLGGVCAGIARHYGFDVTVIRVGWLLLALFTGGFGLILYIATWIVMPRPDRTGEAGGSPRSAEPPGVIDEFRNAGERIVESARVVARHTRESAQEIAEIARTSPVAGTGRPPGDGAGSGAPPGDPAAAAPESAREETEPPVSAEEQQEQQPPPQPSAGAQPGTAPGGTPIGEPGETAGDQPEERRA